jgi:TRAP transporter TAXI family solute receptor
LFGGGPSSSANYTTFAGIGNLITQDHPNYMTNTEISTGSQENIRMIQNGTVQFGVAMTDVAAAAANGTREFEGAPVAISHVMGGYTTMLHMFVPSDSDIQSIGDLKGKKLAVSKGAMAQYYMPTLLDAYDLTMDDVSVTETALQDICDAVNDGNADFGIHITPFTSSPIADLAATKGIRLLSIDAEHIEKIVAENPFFYESIIPGGTYTGIDEDTVVLGTRNNLVCGSNMDEEVVYNVVKTIIQHHDDLANVHPQADQFNKENAVKGALIDIHPGAAKYYKEIGIIE